MARAPRAPRRSRPQTNRTPRRHRDARRFAPQARGGSGANQTHRSARKGTRRRRSRKLDVAGQPSRAELKPKVLRKPCHTSPTDYKRLRRLQDQDIENKLKNQVAAPAQGAQSIQEDQGRAPRRRVKSLRLNRRASIFFWSSSSTNINKRLVGYEGRMMRACRKPWRPRARDFLKNLRRARSAIRAGSTASPNLPKGGRTACPRQGIASMDLRTQIHDLEGETGLRSWSFVRCQYGQKGGAARRARPKKGGWVGPICASFISIAKENITNAASGPRT